MTPRKPIAVRAREFAAKHPSWSETDIAERLGCTRQAVHAALRRTGKRGRPREPIGGKPDGKHAVRTNKVRTADLTMQRRYMK